MGSKKGVAITVVVLVAITIGSFMVWMENPSNTEMTIGHTFVIRFVTESPIVFTTDTLGNVVFGIGVCGNVVTSNEFFCLNFHHT